MAELGWLGGASVIVPGGHVTRAPQCEGTAIYRGGRCRQIHHDDVKSHYTPQFT